MRKARAPFKSFKSLISLKDQTTNLNPNTSFGETIIPIGSDNIEVGLPKLRNTYTYNIINTDRMSGNITLKTTDGGSMVGLMLNSSGGSVSIDPIVSPTSEMTLENDVKDGCYIQTLSNGNNWYIWSVATGGGINVKTNGTNVNYPPTIIRSFADVSNVTITSDIRFVGPIGQEARHDLIFSGEGDPGAFLTISETTGNSDAAAVFPITIPIANDGTWSLDKTTLATNLPNGSYTFDFIPTRGNGVQNKSFTDNSGPITFTVPSAFSPDPGESVNFAAGASAVKPDGTPITVTVDSTAWNSGLAHGATFNIIYSITDAAVNGGVTVSQTVAGEIVDDTPPAAPVILAASIANMNELSANGNAEPGKTITLFQGNLPLSPTVTSHASTGAWSIGPITLSFNSNFTLKAQASEPGVGNPNRSAFGEYSPAFNYVQPQVTKPTLTIDGETKSTWSNSGPKTYTLRGTTQAGTAIAITANGQAVTPASGPTVVDDDWTATLTVANESQTNFKATATLANHLPNESDPYGLLIDRVAPTITLTGGAQTVGLPNVGSSNDLGFSVADASSGVATQTSNWDTQVSTTTQGTYTVTYNATDVAGNSATPVTRYVTVTTEVIIPVITSVTTNSNGTFTIEGTVTGDYADNLTVQVTIGGSNSGSPVSVTSGTFTHITSAQSTGTYEFKAKSINHVGEESDLSVEKSASVTAAPVSNPTITVLKDSDQSPINANDDVTALVGSGFSFTATAVDYSGNDLTNSIQTTSDVDNNSVGNYTVQLSVTDSGGRTSTLNFSVEIQNPAFVEDIPAIITRATNAQNLSIANGILSDTNGSAGSAGLNLNLDTDGLIAYDSATGETVNDEFTISFWAKLDNINANQYFVGTDLGRRVYLVTYGDKTNANLRFGWEDNDVGSGSPHQNFVASVGDFTNWTHFVIRFKQSSTHMVNAVFVNGTEVGLNGVRTSSLGTKHMPPKSNANFTIGGTNGYGSNVQSVEGEFDSIQFGDGIALTDDQISWIAGDSGRQRTIAGALAAFDTPPTITLQGASPLMHVLGQAFTDPGVIARDQLDGNLTPTVSIVDSQNQSVSAIDANTVAGTYTITYAVTDSAGQAATVDRTVNVSSITLGSSLLDDSSVTVTLNGTAALSNGILTLDGASNANYATIPGSSDYDPANGDLTYSAWFKPDDPMPLQQMGILSNITSTTNSWNGFGMQIIPAGTTLPANQGGTITEDWIRVSPNNSAGTEPRLDTPPLDSNGNAISVTTGVWHHLSVTFNSSTNECIAYYDGHAAGSLASNGIAHSNSWAFYIGRQWANSNLTFKGQIQGVRIEQTLRSAVEALEIYNLGPQ